MQSKKHSLIEALTNVFSGMVIAFMISQLAHVYEKEIQTHLWKDFTWSLNATSNLLMTSILTVISVIRGYIWRRIFNKRIKYEITKD